MKNPTQIVKDKYGETARAGLSTDDSGIRAVAEAFGYSAEELASIPSEANMGLSCGNPIATANLRPGEVVVDLGSGGGLDVFLASKAVGPSGKAIGIDMTPDMLALAKENAIKGGYQNVEFLEGTIDKIPLPDNSADIIISNCVINLAEDKDAVFKDMFRVLKPGGRIAISDMATKQKLPAELATSAAALVGCIAGAISMSDYNAGLQKAGFNQVYVQDSKADITAYAKADAAGCCASVPEPESSACCAPPAPKATACCAPPEPKAASSCCGAPPSPKSQDCCPPTTTENSDCCSPTPKSESSCYESALEASGNPTEMPAKPMHQELAEIFSRYDVNEYIASVKVFALKPE